MGGSTFYRFSENILQIKTQTNIILPAPICHLVTKFKYLFHLDFSFFWCCPIVQVICPNVNNSCLPNGWNANLYSLFSLYAQQRCQDILYLHSSLRTALMHCNHHPLFFSFLVLVAKYFSEQAEMMLLIKLWQNNPGKLII